MRSNRIRSQSTKSLSLIFLTLIYCSGRHSTFGQTVTKAEQVIESQTQKIEMLVQSQRNGSGDSLDIAAALVVKGKLLLNNSRRPTEAEIEFARAIERLNTSAVPSPREGAAARKWNQTYGDAHLFLAQAQFDQNRVPEAFKTASVAVNAFRQLVADGSEASEPSVAHATIIKIRALLELEFVDANNEFDTIRELDSALAILQKWSKKSDGTFYASEYEHLEEMRKQLTDPRFRYLR